MAPTFCECPNPFFTTDNDGETTCVHCAKRPTPPPDPPRQSDLTIQRAYRRAKRKAPLTVDRLGEEQPYRHPEEVARSIQAARLALGLPEADVSLPEAFVDAYLPSQLLDKVHEWVETNFPPESLQDPEVAGVIRKEVDELVDFQFSQGHRDAARSAIAYFGSDPEILGHTLKSHKIDARELMNHLGESIAIGLQADTLRRRFGLSESWPAERAIMYGPSAVPPPRLAAVPPLKKQKTLAEQLGRLLYSTVPLPLDDPRSLQRARDEANRRIEKRFEEIREFRRQHGNQVWVKTDEGLVEVEDPEPFIYDKIQEELPRWLQQPLPNTFTPRRVMLQRFADSKKRRQSYRPLSGLITGVSKPPRKNAKRRKPQE